MIATFYIGDSADPLKLAMRVVAERYAHSASLNAAEHVGCPHLIVQRQGDQMGQGFFRITTDDGRVSIDLTPTELRAIIAKTALETMPFMP